MTPDTKTQAALPENFADLPDFFKPVVAAWAKLRRMTPEDFYKLLLQYPGQDITEKYLNYVKSRQFSVVGTLLEARGIWAAEIEQPNGEVANLYSIVVALDVPEDQAKLAAERLGISADKFQDLAANVGIRISSQSKDYIERLYDRVALGDKLALRGLKLKVKNNRNYLNARGATVLGRDDEFLSKAVPISKLAPELDKNPEDVLGNSYLVYADIQGVPDLAKTQTADGREMVSLVYGDSIILQIFEPGYGPGAVSYLKKFGNPWDIEFWLPDRHKIWFSVEVFTRRDDGMWMLRVSGPKDVRVEPVEGGVQQ